MASNPYSGLPDHAFWREAVGQVPGFALDPTVGSALRFSKKTRIATAGSCFAQHIARRLRDSGYSYYIAEPGPAELGPEERTRLGYGVFSARYGNLYTARQLLQLFDQAFGTFEPAVRAWRRADGRFVDPYRPRVEPDGYARPNDVRRARKMHLARVKTMFERLDVMVFTLGLTESWIAKADGAVLPLAPGVAGGRWQPSDYAFVNWKAGEVRDDLIAFADRLAAVNERAKIILTVSPVPLVATYSGQHVLRATVYSKAALRVAAEEAAASRPQITYFPSFEIVTAPGLANRYFEDDLRSVNELGVDHVMRVFFRNFAEAPRRRATPIPSAPFVPPNASPDIVCDEEELATIRRFANGSASSAQRPDGQS